MRTNKRLFAIPLPLMLAALAYATPADISIGFISFDVTAPGSTAAFDISNQSGPNSTPFPDPNFPSVTPVDLLSLLLTVNFSNGSTIHFTSSYFTLAPDGLSWDGGVIPIGGSNPQPTSATLTGSFSPLTLSLNDGSMDSINSIFSSTILPSAPPNLVDGDLL